MKMKLLLTAFFAFSYLLLTAANSNAQVIFRSAVAEGSFAEIGQLMPALGFAGGKQLPNDTAQMLRLPQIKEELGLDDDQTQAIGKLSKAMSEQMSAVFRNVDFGTGDASKIMREAQRAIREKTEEKLEEVLTPRQLTRLKQIKVQSAFKRKGATALLSGELSDTIHLSDKQKGHLKTLHASKRVELEREIAALREKYRKETLAEVLTKSQLSELEKLSGEPYNVKTPNMHSLFASPPPKEKAKKKE